MTRVSIQALEDAFEFASLDPGESSAYLDRRTGEIHCVSAVVGEEGPDDLDESDHYLFVPDRDDLRIGSRTARHFAEDEATDLYEEVVRAFSGPGAFRRFEEILDRAGRREDWFTYRTARIREGLRAWCEAEGIQVVDGGPADADG
ncbi:MAG: UPF0158 family protein [Planctomycetota bacterium]